jgi:hypothetical protein
MGAPPSFAHPSRSSSVAETSLCVQSQGVTAVRFRAPAPILGTVTANVRQWVHNRAHHAAHTRAHVSGQRRLALWLTLFAAARTVLWLVCMLVIVVHWLGGGGSFVHAFIDVSSTVLFVTFISFYCNASTDAANLTAGLAALFSADTHSATIAVREDLTMDLTQIETDIARLADLEPGPEAAALADGIQARLRNDKAGGAR